MRLPLIIALCIAATFLLAKNAGYVPSPLPNPIEATDEVDLSVIQWEHLVRKAYADSVAEDFASDREEFDWLKTRMQAAALEATKPIRAAEAEAFKDGWTPEKSRALRGKWGSHE